MSGDTAALHEVVGELNVRRRYIKPTVRNLDTGETYSVDEVHQRVPQGIDPVHLSPSSKRAGLQAQGKKRSLDVRAGGWTEAALWGRIVRRDGEIFKF